MKSIWCMLCPSPSLSPLQAVQLAITLSGERDQKACSLAPTGGVDDILACLRGEGWGEGPMQNAETKQNTSHTKGASS
jgi:hypothetical protein